VSLFNNFYINFSKRFNPSVVFVFSDAVMSFAFNVAFTAMMVYYIQTAGLSPLQLVLIGTALEIACFTFEVPTGVVADTFSRKWSVILGRLCLGVGIIVEGLFPIFGMIAAMQIVKGVGYTFISGANTAWITDEVGEEQAAKLFMRVTQIGSIAGVVGTVVGMILGSINLQLAIVLGGTTMIVLGVVSVFIMPETGFKPTPRGERTTFQHMTGTFREGVSLARRSPIILTLIAASFVMGAFSESFDRLNEAHILNTIGLPGDWSPVVVFGMLSIAGMPLSLLVMEIMRRRVDTNNQRLVARVLMVCEAGIIGVACMFALAQSFWVAAVALMTVGLLRQVTGVLRTVWLNQHVDSRVRATVHSMHSQADAIGEIAGGPMVGLIGNASLRAALVVGATLLTPNLFLYRRTLNDESGAAITIAETAETAQKTA
jgi:MFS transporter, DHA3 family, tetracycline resistance protein